MSFQSLLPTINPNLDEIAEDNVPLQPPKKKPTPDEIFMEVQATNKKHRQAKKEKGEEEGEAENQLVSPTQNQRQAESPNIKVEIVDKQDKEQRATKKKYPHLEKARAVASANRKRKADEKRALKENQKIEKLRVKQEKAELRKEKNRQRALENYHKKKDLKRIKEIKEEEEIISPRSMSSAMNYDKFAEYMSKWENSKKEKVEKIPSKPIPVRKPQYIPRPVSPPRRPEQPTNYLSFYREKKSVNDLFKL